MLVDDDPLIRLLLRRQLVDRYELEVSEADNGIDALTKVQDGSFDLIVTDNEMPWLNGLGLIANLRTHPSASTTPIIFISGNGSPDLHETAKALGARHCLDKPFSPDSLYRIADSYLPRR